jgi:hypothetical protein
MFYCDCLWFIFDIHCSILKNDTHRHGLLINFKVNRLTLINEFNNLEFIILKASVICYLMILAKCIKLTAV